MRPWLMRGGWICGAFGGFMLIMIPIATVALRQLDAGLQAGSSSPGAGIGTVVVYAVASGVGVAGLVGIGFLAGPAVALAYRYVPERFRPAGLAGYGLMIWALVEIWRLASAALTG